MPRPHMFTMNVHGQIFDTNGVEVARLSDHSNITDFLSGVRAMIDRMGLAVPGTIIRDGDWQAWEKAAFHRSN